MTYGTFETLQQQNAVLRGTVELNSGIQLAAWYNHLDRITVRSDHHTLSLYIADGYESYQKRRTAGKMAAARIVFA
jgi:transcriptional regulator, AraC family